MLMAIFAKKLVRSRNISIRLLPAKSFSSHYGRVTADSGVRGSFDSCEVMAGLYGRGRNREGCALSDPRSVPWTYSRRGLGLRAGPGLQHVAARPLHEGRSA